MKIRRYLLDALAVSVAFIGLQSFQSYLLSEALNQQDHLLVSRLESSLSGVLTEAHKAKDDISIYHIIHALSQSRGITQARLLDEESDKSPRQAGMCWLALKDGNRKWGSLGLSFSDHFNRKLIRHQWLKGTMALGLVWFMLSLHLQHLEKGMADADAKLLELTSLLNTEKKKLCDIQSREQLALLQISAALQKAVGLLSIPVLVLDSQQRLAAISPAALSMIGMTNPQPLLGKSWHEIPLIAPYGQELERSLVGSGQVVLGSALSEDFHLKFETGADGLVGTWVTLSKGLPSVC